MSHDTAGVVITIRGHFLRSENVSRRSRFVLVQPFILGLLE